MGKHHPLQEKNHRNPGMMSLFLIIWFFSIYHTIDNFQFITVIIGFSVPV